MYKNFKRCLSILLILTLVMSIVPISCISVNAAQTYTYGDFEYTLNSKDRTAKIVGYKGGPEAVIPDNIGGNKVISISKAFKNNTTITSVSLPDTIAELEVEAFQKCTNLKTVHMNNTIKYINDYSFDGCTSLENINFPENVISIWSYAFRNCTSLKSVSFAKILGVSEYAFDGCNQLANVNFSDCLIRIRNYAFSNCVSLKNITFPDTLTEIGEFAFYNCISLDRVSFPDTLTLIGKSAFENCTKISAIYFNNAEVKIYARAFYGCKSLTELCIPEKVKELGLNTFSGCTKLKKVFYNAIDCVANDTEIRAAADDVDIYNYKERGYYNKILSGHDEIWKLYTGIGSIFYDCPNFKDLIIGEKVSNIDDFAFAYCKYLENVYYNANNCKSVVSTIHYRNINDELVGYERYDYYAQFYGCDNLKNLYIGENVKRIPDNAFFATESLENVYFNSPVCEYAGTSEKPIFEKCNNIKTINFGIKCADMLDSITTGLNEDIIINIDENDDEYAIYDDVIYTADMKTALYIKKSKDICTISKYVENFSVDFLKSSNIVGKFIVEEGNELYLSENGVIFNKDKSEIVVYGGLSNSYIVPEGVKCIGNYAFYGNSKLENITFNNDLIAIGEHAFQDTTALKSVVIPDSVNELGIACFSRSKALKTVEIGKGVSNIPQFAFSSSPVDNVKLNEGVKIIEPNAFYNCTELNQINIPYSVTEIKDNAFRSSSLDLIYGYNNTYADDYAKTHNYNFFSLGDYKDVLYSVGDVNRNSRIDIQDATQIQKYLVKLDDLDDEQIRLADTDRNGVLNINDVSSIQKYLVGITDSLG